MRRCGDRRPGAGADDRWGPRLDRETRLKQCHALYQATDVAGDGAHRVVARGKGPDTLGRDPSPGGLEARYAAARRRDADGASGARAVADVGLARSHRDGGAGGGTTWHEGRVEWVDGGPESRVDTGGTAGQLGGRILGHE